jgi:hypothetical protein
MGVRSWTVWPLRVAWLLLPLTTGPVLADALAEHSEPVALVAAVLLWAGWAIGLLTLMVRRPSSLTALRCVAPLSPIAAAWAGGTWEIGPPLAAAALAFFPDTGMWLVNGSAYGDERRHTLRAPGALLAGPIPMAWAALVAALATGPLLLAAHAWVAGGLTTVLGAVVVVVAARALDRLSHRWLVFVPAGVVLKDQMAILDPVLLRRQDIASLAPAEVGSTATDLTAGAFGLALELRLREPYLAARPAGRGHTEEIELRAVLVTPTRPGAVLTDAARRRLP